MIKKTITTIILSGAMLASGYLFSIDNSTIVNGKLIYPDQNEPLAIQSNESNTIAETFIITYADNNIIRGELVNGSGEGIYYELNDEDIKEHEAFYNLSVNDLVMIEWKTDNYIAGDWSDIERVLYNGKGNTYESNGVNVAGVNK